MSAAKSDPLSSPSSGWRGAYSAPGTVLSPEESVVIQTGGPASRRTPWPGPLTPQPGPPLTMPGGGWWAAKHDG